MKRRYICLACQADEVGVADDEDSGDQSRTRLFVCFGCQDVFYFMPDAEPRPRELGPFELYRLPVSSAKSRRRR